MEKTTIKVKGMVCTGCENRVKNALNEIEGIKKVDANFKTGEVKVEHDHEVSKEKIEDTILDIGFEVEKED